MASSALEVLEKLKAAPVMDNPHLAKANGTFLQSGSATGGLTYYDLDLGAKLVYPVLTPLRNVIPRVSGRGGIQASWRAITAINASGMRVGVSESNRGGVQAVATHDYVASYKGIGIESTASFEAFYAAQGFDDIRALAAKTGLESLMLSEESMILGGNNSLPLGTPPIPTLTASSTGGSLAAQSWSVLVVPLSHDGMINASVTGGVQQLIQRTNADGSIDKFGGGAGYKSSNAIVTTTGTTSSIAATVTAVPGALGYAWFWGAPNLESLGAITSINSVSIIGAATGTLKATSLNNSTSATDNTDYSTNNLAFDGLLTQAMKQGSGAYYAIQPMGTPGIGTPLTSDAAGGIVEIDLALKSMWDNFRLSPDTIWVNSQEALNLSKKILAGSSSSAQRFVFNSEQGMLGGGIMVRTYLNRFSMQGASILDIKIHPNMPAGTLLMTTSQLPYPLSNVGNVMQIRTRQDYYQVEWPLRSRKYEYGVYADEVLQHYFPPSLAVITNIGNA
ncbi:hypothetical protein [Beijerinckia indica]|uniref:Uncharacterized protein n=1 Tax=Beijerinckia indica subsp. indica (strain ATCC 9039 / DSM 1715 / NCIMB 8712) TaxID=395963 RepID=B2IFS5_BEII9|nr:hypothetical protein [Beijerinckia indica]ACB94286.1 conserved hypothetical protein, putative phage associated protein [Beijerinckia indica subsp. indica ATCC 9039]